MLSLLSHSLVTETILPTPGESPLAAHIRTYLDNAASVSGVGWSRYSTFPTTGQAYSGSITLTRNSSFWLSALDLSCSPIGYIRSNTFYNYGRGALVTRRHLMTADHFEPQPGDVMIFHGNDDQVYTRAILPDPNTSIGDDVRISLLASAVPTAVVPAKVFPADVDDYFTASDFIGGIGCVAINQYLQAVAQHRVTGFDAVNYYTRMISEGPQQPLSKALIQNDSGSPYIVPVNGVPVLLGCAHGVYEGPLYHRLRTQINAAIAASDSNYTTTAVDLSEFAP